MFSYLIIALCLCGIIFINNVYLSIFLVIVILLCIFYAREAKLHGGKSTDHSAKIHFDEDVSLQKKGYEYQICRNGGDIQQVLQRVVAQSKKDHNGNTIKLSSVDISQYKINIDGEGRGGISLDDINLEQYKTLLEVITGAPIDMETVNVEELKELLRQEMRKAKQKEKIFLKS